jgi:cytochrome b involved in lipid metabolism
MSETKEFTYSDVSEHATKKDLYIVVHDKVYDCTSFVDEHPGGEEVLLDVGGQDSTEAFEDVGHSDEARETLDKLLVGTLKRKPGDPAPKTAAYGSSAGTAKVDSSSLGIGSYLIVVLGGIAAYGAYLYSQQQQVVGA